MRYSILAFTLTLLNSFRIKEMFRLTSFLSFRPDVLRSTLSMEVPSQFHDSKVIPQSSTAPLLPKKRDFISLNEVQYNASATSTNVLSTLRILQLNMLADGLSGLRKDLGAFSRARSEFMHWPNREYRLIYEMLQYQPDIIALQECDHYEDFFLPTLASYGYRGYFTGKPASACREVSVRSDGCAILYKADRFELLSASVCYAFIRYFLHCFFFFS
jgi:mRNA deadenylase 3'-5' endonuclease subunit Ccr4